MENIILTFLSNAPLHSILLFFVLLLYRDNRRLHAKVEKCLKNLSAATSDRNVDATILPVTTPDK